MNINIDKVLERGQALQELDEKADVMYAHASSFKSSAPPRSGRIPSFGTKLSEAANWVSSKFKREKTWESAVVFCTIIISCIFLILHPPPKSYETKVSYHF